MGGRHVGIVRMFSGPLAALRQLTILTEGAQTTAVSSGAIDADSRLDEVVQPLFDGDT